MGHFSDLAIEMAERRVRPDAAGGRRVCSLCFADPHLADFVVSAADRHACDYCGAEGEEVRAAPLERVVEFMLGQIDLEYASADEALPRDPETKGRMFAEDEFDTRELLEGHLELELPNDGGRLIDDIAGTLPEQDWCLVNPLGTRDDEAIGNSWGAFKRVISHRRRFFFLQQPDPELSHDLAWGEAAFSIPELLERIAAFAHDHGLLATMPAGSVWVRCQGMADGDAAFGARRMGPPPYEFAALPNRMSPAGVPMFYGARTRETALAEVADAPGRFAAGTFETTRDALVLDLRAAPPVPSLFDVRFAKDRAVAMFMHAFVDDFRAPIDRKRRPHVDYLPTQVVTEYFRTMVTEGGTPVEGVHYTSTRDGGDAVVIFAENGDVVSEAADDDWASGEPWLAMTGYEEVILELAPAAPAVG